MEREGELNVTLIRSLIEKESIAAVAPPNTKTPLTATHPDVQVADQS
jgi:hypothetical protein